MKKRTALTLTMPLALMLMNCSEGSFGGGGSVLKRSKNENKKPDSDQQTDVNDNDEESGEPVVGNMPTNVAGSYLTCVSEPLENSPDDALMGCILVNQAGTERLNLSGLRLDWKLYRSDDSEIEAEQIPVSGSGSFHGLFKMPGTSVENDIKVHLKIAASDGEIAVNQDSEVFSDSPLLKGLSPNEEKKKVDAPFDRHFVFITKGKYRPGKKFDEDGFNKIKYADSLCNLEAERAGVAGRYSWRAVMGDSKKSVRERIKVKFDIYSAGPDKSLIFKPDPAVPSFFDQALFINKSADGAVLFDAGDLEESKVWTGASASSSASLDGSDDGGNDDEKSKDNGSSLKNEFFCGDWKSAAGTGVFGTTGVSEKWLNAGTESCEQKFRLVCINQELQD